MRYLLFTSLLFSSLCIPSAFGQLGDAKPVAKADPQKSADPQKPEEQPAPPVAAVTPDPQGPKVVHLSLSPAAEAKPALRYSLSPRLEDRKPGNGAQFYYRAILLSSQSMQNMPVEQRTKHWETFTQLSEAPLAKFSPETARKWLQMYGNVLRETRVATHREECNWDHRPQDIAGFDSVAFLLPEIQEMRTLARAISIKAKLAIAEGKFDEAVADLQDGFQLAQDASQEKLLICKLVGIACASVMNEQVIGLIDQPGSPNLYWALAQIPREQFKMQTATIFESSLPFRMFPFLKDAETVERTPGEWQGLLERSMKEINSLGFMTGAGSSGSGNLAENDWTNRLAIAAMMIKYYPAAKSKLLASGMDEKKLEKMPAAQAVVIQAARDLRHTCDEFAKWSGVPYAQAKTGQREAMERLKKEGYFTEGLGGQLAGLLLPAVEAAWTAEVRLERNFRAIQVIEAIRMHMAANGGKLPASLEEIKVVPVPQNPFNDLPFSYFLTGDTARLEVSGANQAASNLVYVLTADPAK